MSTVQPLKRFGLATLIPLVIWVAPASADVSIGRASVVGAELNRVFIDAPGSTEAGDVAIGGDHIFWINGDSIGRADLDGLNVDPEFITGVGSASGLAANDGYVYWGGASIGRARVDGTDVERDLMTPAGGADDVAANAQYLFWTSDVGIGRANLDGAAADPGFIDTGVTSTPDSWVSPPAQLAINASHAFWVYTAYHQYNATSNVARASLGGSGGVEILESSKYVLHGDFFGPLGADDTRLFARVVFGLADQVIRSVGVSHLGWAPSEPPTSDDSFSGGVAVADGYVYWAHNGETTLSCDLDPKRRQTQRGPRVRFEVRFAACEQVSVAGRGRVRIAGERYRLKPFTATVGPSGAKLAVKSERRSRREVLAAITDGYAAHARIQLRVTDLSGNKGKFTVDVRLKRR